MPKWRREAQHKLRELDRQVTRSATVSLIHELRSAYRDLPAIVGHLDKVREDVLDNAQFFQQTKDGEPGGLIGLFAARSESGDAPLRRYAVNLLDRPQRHRSRADRRRRGQPDARQPAGGSSRSQRARS